MAYFLGIQTPEGLKPLKVYNKNNDVVANSILALVDFTSSFDTSAELLDYLKETGSIEDYNSKLYYLIDKGQKGHKTYSIVPGSSSIIYADNKNNFNPKIIRKKLHNRAFNIYFIEHLYAFYLKKFGIYNKCINYFHVIGSHPYELCKIISELVRYPFSEQVKSHLYQILDILDNAISRNGVRFFEGNEAKRFYSLLDQLDNVFQNTDRDIIMFSRRLSNNIKTNSIGTLVYLSSLYQMVHNASACKDNLFPSDREDLSYYIDQFLDFTIYNYDKKSSSFKTVNGRRKIQERNLFDLGVFLTDYDEYEIYLYQAAVEEKTSPNMDEGDHEEFLEEEDFARLNTTSEESGITLRMSDGMKYGNKW